MKLRKIVALIPILVFSFLVCGCARDDYEIPYAFKYYVYRNKIVFGDGITFSAAVRGGNETAALDEMVGVLTQMNAELSLTDASSAVSRFNELGGDIEYYDGYESEKVEISQNAYELVQLAFEFNLDTDGLFDISVYPLAELWGVDAVSLADSDTKPIPSQTEILGVKEYCDMSYLKTCEADGKCYIYKTHPRLHIDFGAVAKGYAADKCMDIARAHGVESALINIGGNICVLGEWYHPERKTYERWALGITSPRPRGGLSGDMCALSVGGGKTLVTSGDYVRYRVVRSEESELYVPHIVNCVSGLPLGVERDESGNCVNSSDSVVSATIICDNSAKADAYATAVCLMSREKGAEFLYSRGLHGILVSADNVMMLVGVTERDDSGEEYFIFKSGDDAIDKYKRYTVEEYSVG